MTDITPDAGVPEPLEPVIHQPSKFKAFVNRFRKPPFLVLGAIVLLFVLMIVGRGFNSKPKPVTQNLGVQRLDPKAPTPTETPDYIADAIKDRDQKAGEKLLANEQAIKSGMAYMPAVTKEYDDPLGDYAATSAAAPQKKEAPLADIPLPPVSTDDPPSTNPGAPHRGHSSSGSNPDDGRKGRSALLVERMRELGIDRSQRLALEPEPAVVTVDVADRSAGAPGAAATDLATKSTDRTPTGRVLARMGSDLYAAMDFEANSDYSKFAAATVIGGPFDGAKLHGSFERTGDALEIVFNRIAWKGGTYDIDALATTPENPKVGLASEVNRHYLERFGGLFVAAFLSGVGTELAQEGTIITTNISSGTVQSAKPDRSNKDLAVIGAGAVATEVASILRSGVNRAPTVIVAASTPIGVRFRSDWVESSSKSLKDAATAAAIAGPTPGDSRAEIKDLEIEAHHAAE